MQCIVFLKYQIQTQRPLFPPWLMGYLGLPYPPPLGLYCYPAVQSRRCTAGWCCTDCTLPHVELLGELCCSPVCTLCVKLFPNSTGIHSFNLEVVLVLFMPGYLNWAVRINSVIRFLVRVSHWWSEAVLILCILISFPAWNFHHVSLDSMRSPLVLLVS